MGPSLETCNGIDDDCNGIDDDCNGVVDTGYLHATDPRGCGSCGHICSFAHAGATCAGSGCVMGSCAPGFVNRDGNPANGCEFACSYTGAEVCNGLDDDCDGVVDKGLTAASTFCNANGVCAGTSPTCGRGQPHASRA